METSNKITKVVFRKFQGEVMAFLPELPANSGNIVCYTHNEQHNEATFGFYRSTKPCPIFEYAHLISELENRGYSLKVYRKIAR